MAKTQKSQKLSSNSKRLSASKPKYIIAIVVIAAVLLSGFVYITILKQQDKRGFVSAQKRIVTLAEAMQPLDAVSEHTERSYCYQSEQGPFDHGRLWCSVESYLEAKPADYPQAAQLAESIHSIVVRAYGNKVTRSTFGTSTERGLYRESSGFSESGKICKAETRYTSQDNRMAITLSCSARAKAKHYPYMN